MVSSHQDFGCLPRNLFTLTERNQQRSTLLAFGGHRWIHHTKGQSCAKCLDAMPSSSTAPAWSTCNYWKLISKWMCWLFIKQSLLFEPESYRVSENSCELEAVETWTTFRWSQGNDRTVTTWKCLYIFQTRAILYGCLKKPNHLGLRPCQDLCTTTKRGIADKSLINRVIDLRSRGWSYEQLWLQTGRTWSCDQSCRVVPSISHDSGQTSRATGVATGWTTMRSTTTSDDWLHDLRSCNQSSFSGGFMSKIKGACSLWPALPRNFHVKIHIS